MRQNRTQARRDRPAMTAIRTITEVLGVSGGLEVGVAKLVVEGCVRV